MPNPIDSSVARSLRAHADVLDPPRRSAGPPLDLAVIVRGLSDGSFRKHDSPELRAVLAFEEEHGAVPGTPQHQVRLSPDFFRFDGMTTGPGGGYLTPNRRAEYIPALAPFDPIVARVTVTRTDRAGAVSRPRGAGQITSTWQSPEGGNAAEQTLTLGEVNSTPRTLTSYLRASRQLLIQSDAGDVLTTEMKRSAASTLSTAIAQATGYNGQPTGVLNTPGIGTASGASIAYGGIVTAIQAPADASAIVDPNSLAWITTPTVAGILKGRFKNGAGSDAIWQGGMPLGEIERTAAFATKLMPAATALYGDWSSVEVVEYPGGALLEVDPFSDFRSGLYGMRLTLYCDVIVKYPTAFYSLTGIS